ncbi:zinc transporter ZntB [Pseudooceanicola sp.]|uniref:zinc transporter ZntB n=1 Tax=Pseudooceanicola sp. TaxID=1914328 RepID=UPI002605AB8C|nr:zinc transporter ZntB [Pseudooceanicola sp.]MDF1857056.1 zinc transporter ZntB [Pseudooceanicola sp.]
MSDADTTTETTTPFQMGYALNGPLAGQSLDAADAANVLRDEALGWAHLSADHPDTPDWIARNLAYLDSTVIEALTSEVTRPRATAIGEGMLVVLRGLNLNEGMDPEDMVSVRMWIDAQRIVTLSRQRVRALEDLATTIAAGQGPDTAGAFLSGLAERLNVRLEPFVRDLDQTVDGLEAQVIGAPDQTLRRTIVTLRLTVIELRRHAVPQRIALQELYSGEHAILAPRDLRNLQETHDRLTRVLENLDELRDNLTVLRDELAGQLSDRLNNNMFMLSILSAIFLPLGFLTGLFGINLAGMPGAGHPWAFWLFCGGLVLVAGLQFWILRRLKWL